MDKARIIQFNCCGIKAKFNDIKQMIIKYNPDFILLQELKIKKNDKVKFKGYTLLSKHIDDESTTLTSVGILIKDGIIYSEIDLPDDMMVIGINTVCSTPISLFSYYDNHRINKLSANQLKCIIDSGKHKPIIMGDFNTKSFLWDSNRKFIFNDHRANKLIDFLDDSEMVLLNDGSTTRISPIFNQKNSALDLTLVHKDLHLKFNWSVAESEYGSDHLPTLLSPINKDNFTTHERIIWALKTTDWDLFNEVCDLNLITEAVNVDDMDEIINKQIIKGLEASTKFYKFPNNKKRSPPWWDDELRNLKKEKIKLLKKYVKKQTKENLTNLKKFNALFRKKLRKKKQDSWEKYINDINGDMELKDLWNRVRKVNGENVSKHIRNLLNDNDEIIEDKKLIVDMLGKHYESISSTESLDENEIKRYQNLKQKTSNLRITNDFTHLNKDFSINEMRVALKNTHDSAPGPDGLKYKIYKNLSSKNQNQLLKFYNRIWSCGIRPKSWSFSTIIPIKKNRNVMKPDNTRPINLINNITKLMDKMVNARLINTLESNNILDKTQFGFRQNKQCLDSIMKINNDVLEARKLRSHTQLVSFDIKKAFDTTWPDSIIWKLQSNKIGGNLLTYLKKFLGPRYFKVFNNSTSSEIFNTNVGVPQGSPLSSTLFLIAFQHILDALKPLSDVLHFSAYADDLVIYVTGKDNMKNQQIIQKSINDIAEAGLSVGLLLSEEKTKSLHMCTKRNCFVPDNYINGKIITKVDNLKILGLIFQKNFSYNNHINYICNKLSKDIQVIKVLSSARYGVKQDILRSIIVALSVPKIRYCLEIYGHTNKANKKKINTKLNHLKRLMLNAFVSTPITTLDILSGIDNIHDLILKSNLLAGARFKSTANQTYSNIISNNKHNNMVHNNFSDLNLIGTTIVKNLTMVSPQISIQNQVFLNIYKKKKEDIIPSMVNPLMTDFVREQGIVLSVYTDGSKINDNISYAVICDHSVVDTNKLHPMTSIYTAEAIAILKAVEFINSVPIDGKKAIITDSRSVLAELVSSNSKKSEITNIIKNSVKEDTIIIWVPSHSKIRGNDFADETAKNTNMEIGIFEDRVYIQDIVRNIKIFCSKLKQYNWSVQMENKLFKIKQTADFQSCDLEITKKEEMVLNRIRSGHSFLTHSHLISKETPRKCNFCDEILSISHLFECNSNINNNFKTKYDILDWKNDIFDVSKIREIFTYLKDLNYFNLI